MQWQPGDVVAYRVRVRIDPARPDGEIGAVFPVRIVRDAPDEIVVYQAPGSIGKLRRHEGGGPRDRVILAMRDGYEDNVWRRWRRLYLRRPADMHMLSLFLDDDTDALKFWYIDFVSPLMRTPGGFEAVDHGIDVIVEPDLSAWSWKDAEELDWYVEHGRYSRAEADRIRAEGERAVARLRAERSRYERWLSWRPEPSWSIPILPSGWDVE
jgi:hypothetical protein